MLKGFLKVCFFLLVLGQTVRAQSFLPLCKNFGPEDYSEDAEFRCATTDHRGTLYFGSNYGIFIYKGEKRSNGKNWRILTLPQPDVIYSLYMDTSAKRMYVGGQSGFGYFQMTAYDTGSYISLKEKLPASLQNNGETWHVEKCGTTIVFHTLANLLAWDGEKLNILPAPDKGIFHNIFKTHDNSLLINGLDKGWFIFKNQKLSAPIIALPADKCYSVLSTKEKNVYLFFFRNQGVWKVEFDGSSILTSGKISDDSFDKVLSEKQIYCAAFSADTGKIVIGTLGGGALLANYTQKLSQASLLSDMQATTGILSCYGLFTDQLKNTWILGKSNLSRLPSDINLLHQDFRGTTVKSLSLKGKELYIASANGLYKLGLSNGLFSASEKILDGDFNKVIFGGDTLFANTSSELITVFGKKTSRVASPAPINAMSRIRHNTWIATQNGLYNSVASLLHDEALIKEKNILQAIQINEKIYVLVDGEGILQCNDKGEELKMYKLTGDFSSTRHAKLFSDGSTLLVSNLDGIYRVGEKDISLVGDPKEKLWLFKTFAGGVRIKFQFDSENNTSLYLREAGDTIFKKANTFMSPVEVNDAGWMEGYYYLATKTGLFISKLWMPETGERAHIFKINAGLQTYTPEKAIRIAYKNNRMVTIYCGLSSFYDAYPNTTYQYRLLNYEDANWYQQKNSEINFSHLPWGDYTLELKVIYGNQQETPVTMLTFTILKPWWATWWALVIWILLFLLFVYAVVQISIYRLKRAKIKLEKTVEERTAEVVHQKNEIETQKEEIEHKNHEITDSINYAQRIQHSLLKDESKLRSHLPGAFVLYLPKDIVSGDFYWFADIGEYTVLAAADCTGHGVPGAFMSMLGVAKLNELAAKNIFMPDQLLHELNHLIVETLGQNTANSDSRDGMDIALVSLHKKNKKLYYAGANRPLYIVNKKERSISEIKPTKLPVGGGQYGENRDYKVHEITISGNLSVYLCTDGYADQFGGPAGKKLMSKRMQQILIDIAALSPGTQKERLKETYLNWKGRLEQIDDVCIAGINFAD